MQRELSIWKRQVGEAQKRITQLKSTVREKDAGDLKEIEELRAMAGNKHESLETMVRTLE